MNYPIKRRGAPRRLDPNWDGIRWLEEESADDTEIYQEEVFPDDGIKYIRAYGRGQKSYPRPMFQIIPNGAFSGAGPNVTPCQCDRFDQSWACPDHPDIGWDPVRRRWRRPCTGDRTRCECDPCHERRQRAQERSSGYTDMGTDGLRPPAGLYDQLVSMFGRPLPQSADPNAGTTEAYRRIVSASSRCTCSMCQPRATDGRDYSYEATVLRDSVMQYASREALRSGWPVGGLVLGRQALVYADGRIEFTDRRRQPDGQPLRGYWPLPPSDPNEGRPGYHYEAITDRWVPDTNDALGDFRAGGSLYANIEVDEDAVREALGPVASSWRDRLMSLSDVSVTLTGTFTGSFTLEIESETEQGAGPLAIEVEPSRGSTD